ncbi:MAG: hypothetical protein ACXWLM_09770, partial [Myxococcales bacterium]
GNLLGGVTSVVRLKELEPASFALRPAFFVLMPVALFCVARRWRERPALLVASAVFALLGLRAIRMVSEAQMVWAPSLAWGLSRLRWKPVFGIAAAALAALSLRLRVPALSPAWDSTLLPVCAARFLQAHAISGPGFTAFRDGGYLEMAGLPAFIDGRVEAVPPQALLDLQQAELSAPAFQAYLRRLGCEWAITTRVRERLGGWHLLHEAPDWKVVYWDEASEVYVRRDVARFARLPEYLHFHPWGHVVQDLSPRELPLLLDEVDRYRATAPADPFAALVRCVALRRLGSPAAAAACAGQAAP